MCKHWRANPEFIWNCKVPGKLILGNKNPTQSNNNQANTVPAQRDHGVEPTVRRYTYTSMVGWCSTRAARPFNGERSHSQEAITAWFHLGESSGQGIRKEINKCLGLRGGHTGVPAATRSEAVRTFSDGLVTGWQVHVPGNTRHHHRLARFARWMEWNRNCSSIKLLKIKVKPANTCNRVQQA